MTVSFFLLSSIILLFTTIFDFSNRSDILSRTHYFICHMYIFTLSLTRRRYFSSFQNHFIVTKITLYLFIPHFLQEMNRK